MPLTAKQTTAASAATSMMLALRCRKSTITALMAKIRPNTFSHNGAWMLLSESLRKRSCKRRAASPIAATTTRASGLKNAPCPV